MSLDVQYMLIIKIKELVSLARARELGSGSPSLARLDSQTSRAQAIILAY